MNQLFKADFMSIYLAFNPIIPIRISAIKKICFKVNGSSKNEASMILEPTKASPIQTPNAVEAEIPFMAMLKKIMFPSPKII